MAQWSRQYTGNTHGTRISDREGQLRHAIEVYRQNETSSDAQTRIKTIVRMANRLLASRIDARKSNVPPSGQIDTKLQAMLDGGVLAILSEFGIPDIEELIIGGHSEDK